MAMLVTVQRTALFTSIAPVTALGIGAIALLLMGLLLYLSRLLATRLAITLQDIPPPPRPEQLRQQLINEVKREISFPTPPDREALPERYRLPWNSELRVGKKAIKLTTTRHLIDAFQQPQMANKLLILGNAGSGKTTLLMHLVEAALHRSQDQPDAPIPVILNLCSWSPQYLSFEQWLVIELKARYGLRSDVGQYWLETRQLLLFLDGLDELPAELQVSCLQAINQFQHLFQPSGLVVCAEPEEQRAMPIHVNGMICLQPLTIEQVQRHLDATLAVSAKQRAAAAPETAQSISWHQQDPQLLQLARSPLMLQLIPQLDRVHPITSTDDLLALYIKQKLGRDNPHSSSPHGLEPQPSQTLRWLSWLARNLQKREQNEFLIERMQPNWLPSRWQRLWHRVGVVALAAGLVSAIAALTDLISDLGITSPLFWGIVAAAIALFPDQINLVETLSWSRYQARRGLVIGALVGAIGSLCLGVFLVAICAVIFLIDPIYTKVIQETLISGGILGIVVLLATGIMGALLTGLLGPAIERRIFPNQGIWRSAKNTLIFALTGFIIGSCVTGIFSGVINLFSDIINPLIHVPSMFRILYYPPVMIKTGLMIGAISGLTAGIACLQHFVLRVMLWYNGSIPWNYARFLKHVTQRQLMQQIGGRYHFTHNILRNYFAQSYSSASPSSASKFSVPVVGSNNTL
jgi:energy-coupling factor transporter ATP-binding protein EcfA2